MRKQRLETSINPFAAALAARQTRRWAALSSLLAPGLALAGPTGGQVVGGQALISTPDALTTVVDQSSQAAILHWQQFNVGSEEYVIFNQPNASAAVLNRVLGGSPSEILGQLQSNGRVYLVNPQGVLFGAGSSVDVGSLVATTLDIADQDFLQGKHVFSNPGSGSIENQGQIQAAEGGFVVLAADTVRNTGVIAARLGDVVLAAGSQMTLDLNGDGLVNFTVNQASVSDRAGLANLGDLIAQGGSVIMNAQTARQLMGAAVNNSGRVTASGIEERGGEIWLTAGGASADVLNTGNLEANGAPGAAAGAVAIRASGDVTLAGSSVISAAGRDGGTVRAIAGERLTHAQGSRIDVSRTTLTGRGGFAELSGAQISIRDIVRLGGGGRLLIDPASVTIGAGGDIEESVLENQLQSASAGDQIQIIASERITLLNLSDDRINGETPGQEFAVDPDPLQGGSLLLGIGTVDPDVALNVNAGFIRGDGVAGGGIFFNDENDAIQVDGNLDLLGGNLAGDIDIGGLTSRNGYINVSAPGGMVTIGRVVEAVTGAVDVNAEGDIFLQGVFARGGVDLISNAGGVTAGDVGNNGGGKVYITAANDVELQVAHGNEIYITTGGEVRTVLNGRNNGEDTSPDLTGLYTLGSANGIYVVGGSLDLGNINTPNPLPVDEENIILSPTTVSLVANTGNATVGNVSATQYLTINAAGGITTGSLDVTTISTADQERVTSSLTLAANRNIGQGPLGGSLTVNGTVTTRTIGQHLDNSTTNTVTIYNGDYQGSGQQGESLYSGGAVTVTGAISNLHTPTGTGTFSTGVSVAAHNGFNLTVADINPGNGSIELDTDRNTDGVTVGNIIAGTLTPGLGSLSIVSGGSLTLPANASFTANNIEITAGAGDLTLGTLTATSGNILVESAGDLTLTGDASYSGQSEGEYLDRYIELTAGGDLDIQDVTVDVTATGNGSSAYSGIYLSARGGITAGDLSAIATATGDNGFSNAEVYITANDAYQTYDPQSQSYLPPLGGDLEAGSVTLSSISNGVGGDADAYLYVQNHSSVESDTETVQVGGTVTLGPVQVVAEDDNSLYYGGDANASIEALGDVMVGFDADAQTSSGDFIEVSASGSPDKYATLDIYSYEGSVTTSAIEVNGHYEGEVDIEARGGAIEVRGDVAVTGETYSYIGLYARGGIQAGVLDARTLGVSNNNYVSSDVDVAANYQYYYDGQAYLPALGGNIILAGVHVSAVGQQLSTSAEADVDLENYGPVSATSGNIIVNGTIQAVSTATAYDQSANECSTCTTYSEVEVDLDASGDITVTGATTLNATGASSTADGGQTIVPADRNTAYLNVIADYQSDDYGSDINLGDISLSDGGELYLYAASADESGETVDRGTISIGSLSASSGSLDLIQLYSHGSTTVGSSSLTAGAIIIEAGSILAPNAAGGLDLTGLRGGVFVQTRDGDLNLGDVNATNDLNPGSGDLVALASSDYYYDYYGGVFINAAGGNLVTGNVSATGSGFGTSVRLSALGGVRVNGDLTATDTATTSSGFYTPSAFVEVQANAWQYSYTQEPLGGDIVITGTTRAQATGIGGDPYVNSASAHVSLRNDTNYFEIFDPQDESYDSFSFYEGGISTGAVSAIATGLPHDEQSFPGGLSYTEAEVDISSNRDFSSNGADITASASGADQNGSSVEIYTQFGGDIIAETITAATGGNISLTAHSDETGQNLGNIDVHEVSGGTENPSLEIFATGDITIDILPADDIVMTSTEGDISVGDLSTLNGRIDIEAYSGGISTGNLVTNRGGIFLDAAAYISTGSLSTDDDGLSGFDTGIYLSANRDFSSVEGGSAPLGGDISIYGDINADGPVELRNPGGSINWTGSAGAGFQTLSTVAGTSVLGNGLLAEARDNIHIQNLSLEAAGLVDLRAQMETTIAFSSLDLESLEARGAVVFLFESSLGVDVATLTGPDVAILNSEYSRGALNIDSTGNGEGSKVFIANSLLNLASLDIDANGSDVRIGDEEFGSAQINATGGIDVDATDGSVFIYDSTVAALGHTSLRAAAQPQGLNRGGLVDIRESNVTGGGIQGLSAVADNLYVNDSALNGSVAVFSAPDLEFDSVTINAAQSFDIGSGSGVSGGSVSLTNVCLNDVSHGCIQDQGPSALSGTGTVHGATVVIDTLYTGMDTLNINAGVGGLQISNALMEYSSASLNSAGNASLSGTFTGNLGVQALSGSLALGPDSDFSGSSASFQAASIQASESQFIYSGSLSFTAGTSATTTIQAKTLTVGSILLSNILIEAGRLGLTAQDGITSSGVIDVGALAARGSFIDMGLTALTVGSGNANTGLDPGLIAQLALDVPGLLPGSLAPNAAFVSGSDVVIGSLDMQGDYLFVKADAVTVTNLAYDPDQGLLFNFTPTSDTGPLDLNNALDVSGDNLDGLSLALGGSSYTGDISLTQTLDLRPDAVNVLFFTEGTVSGAQNILSNGRVLVLGEVITLPPNEELQKALNQASNISTALSEEQAQDDDQDEGQTYDSGDSGVGEDSMIEQKTQDDEGKLECT